MKTRAWALKHVNTTNCHEDFSGLWEKASLIKEDRRGDRGLWNGIGYYCGEPYDILKPMWLSFLVAHKNLFRLKGDFDSSAAQELLNALEKGWRFASRAFIWILSAVAKWAMARIRSTKFRNSAYVVDIDWCLGRESNSYEA